MHMYLSLVFSIRPSGRWLDVVSSNSLRNSSNFRFRDRVLWLLTLRVFAMVECVKKVRTFRSQWACCFWVDVLHLILNYFCHAVVRSLFHVSKMSKVAVKLLVETCFVPMSAVALCSGCQSPFLEVWFDRRLTLREAEHLSPYCPIPYGAKRYT